MSNSVNYVREKKIPGLLNDMVVHLLSSKPTDVMSALIDFLSKHPDASTSHVPSPPKEKPHSARPTTTVTESKSDKSAQQPAESLPPMAEKEATALAQHLLEQLSSSEKELNNMLSIVLSDQTVDQDLRTLISNASAQNAELLSVTKKSDYTLTMVAVSLDRIRSEMTDTEYYASKGFRLIHDIDVQERQARAIFQAIGVDVYNLPTEERVAVQQAIRVHEEFVSLMESIEDQQLQIAVKANGGAVNKSVAQYFENLSSEMNTTCRELRSSTTSLKAKVIPNSQPAKPRNASSLKAEADAILADIKVQEASIIAAVAAIDAGDDLQLRVLVAEALESAKTLERLADTVAVTNGEVSSGASNQHMSYDDIRNTVRQLNDRITTKMVLVHKSHASALTRVISSLTAKAKIDTAATTATIEKALGGVDIPEARQALQLQKELESLVAQVDATQLAISSHTVAH